MFSHLFPTRSFKLKMLSTEVRSFINRGLLQLSYSSSQKYNGQNPVTLFSMHKSHVAHAVIEICQLCKDIFTNLCENVRPFVPNGVILGLYNSSQRSFENGEVLHLLSSCTSVLWTGFWPVCWIHSCLEKSHRNQPALFYNASNTQPREGIHHLVYNSKYTC